MPLSTITLQSVADLARMHTELVPIAGIGGFTNEPALSLCNDTLQELFTMPLAWKFNRVEPEILVTQQNKQDYLYSGAVALTTFGGVGIGLASDNAITESGNTVTVNTLEPHNFKVGATVFMTGNTVPDYNSTISVTPSLTQWTGGWIITAVPSITSFQFTHATGGLASSGAPGISDFGWLESATMVDINDNSSPQRVRHIQATRTIQPESRVEIPSKVAVMKDYGTGILKVRFRYVPSSAPWAVKMVYQAKPPLKTALSDTWYPFPDNYAFVYRQMFLARAYRFVGSPRSEVEQQKAMRAILQAMGNNDQEDSEEYIAPEVPLMGWYLW